MTRYAILGLFVMLAVKSHPVSAQGNCSATLVLGAGSCSVTTGASVTISSSSAVYLYLSASTTTLPSPSTTDFANGVTQPVGLSMTYGSNGLAVVTGQCGQATWTATGSNARTNKPCSDLQYGTSVLGLFTSLSTGSTTLFSLATPLGPTTSTIYLRAAISSTLDTPGTYVMPLSFTITAP